MNDTDRRRPLKTRQAAWAGALARWLSRRAITPNQISLLSIAFALGAALCLSALPRMESDWGRAALPLLAAAGIQLRLLANMLDGMVAVEGGKRTANGELYNDVPDRAADALILVAAGYAAAWGGWAVAAGWCAALLAVGTAYVRTLGTSLGAPASFMGPMAKPHRMFVMTLACLATPFESLAARPGTALLAGLAVVIVGSTVTIWRRLAAVNRFLHDRNTP